MENLKQRLIELATAVFFNPHFELKNPTLFVTWGAIDGDIWEFNDVDTLIRQTFSDGELDLFQSLPSKPEPNYWAVFRKKCAWRFRYGKNTIVIDALYIFDEREPKRKKRKGGSRSTR